MKNTKPKAVIIGAGVGGLSLGPMLSKNGFDVHIYESNKTIGGRANILKKNGFTFDTGPSLLNYPWVYEDYFNSLGKNFYDYVELISVDPAVNFMWRDHSNFQLSSDMTTLSEEVAKFNSEDRYGLVDFFKNSNKKYNLAFEKLVTKNSSNIFSWLKNTGMNNLFKLGLLNNMYDEIGKYFNEKKIIEAFSSYSMYLGDSPYKLPGFFSILPFGELQYGLWMPKGGMYGLIMGLKKLNEDFNVTINTEKRVEEINIENDQVKGVTLSDQTHIKSDIVVSNVDSSTTFQSLINDDKKFKKYKMTPSVYTFYWGINKKIDSMTHHTIFLPNNFKKTFNELFINKEIPEDLPFYISIPSKTDNTLAPKNNSSVFALVPCPVISTKKSGYDKEDFSQIKSRIFERLDHQKINLSENDIIFEEVWDPNKWESEFGLFDGSAFGPSHNFFQIGPFRNQNMSKKYKNLYFVGASTTPGTGVPMCVLSSKMTTEKILTHYSND